MTPMIYGAQAMIPEELAWTLIHFAWEGTAIAVLLAAILPILRKPTIRYGIACTAMLAMLVTFGVTLAILIQAGVDSGGSASAFPGTTDDGPASIKPTIFPEGVLAPLQPLLPWIAPLWMTGAGLTALYHLIGGLAAQRIRQRGVCPAPQMWQERLYRLAERMNVLKPVALLESSLVDSPVMMGLLRPVILAPVGMLAGLPVNQVESILLHELAHIRRWDYLVNGMQTITESLLFYHPAVWWLSRVVRVERENCCDDAVVAVQGDARSYAAALVTLEERRWAGSEAALAATGGNLMNRVQRLLNQGDEPRRPGAPVLLTAILLSFFCFAAMGQKAAPKSGVEDVPRAGEDLSGAYQRWLNEDVAYIIRDDEREAFQKLQGNQQHEEFIRQFWLRREPAHSDTLHVVRDEHYRRIAYANEHFWEDVAGWKTDRGRFYIVSGPPNEIISSPGLERWRYSYMEGVGRDVKIEFVEAGHSGKFRIREAGSGVKAPRAAATATAIRAEAAMPQRISRRRSHRRSGTALLPLPRRRVAGRRESRGRGPAHRRRTVRRDDVARLPGLESSRAA